MELIEYTNYPCCVKGDLRILCIFRTIRQVFGDITGDADATSLVRTENPGIQRKRQPLFPRTVAVSATGAGNILESSEIRR